MRGYLERGKRELSEQSVMQHNGWMSEQCNQFARTALLLSAVYHVW